jgi:hypothetical protein
MQGWQFAIVLLRSPVEILCWLDFSGKSKFAKAHFTSWLWEGSQELDRHLSFPSINRGIEKLGSLYPYQGIYHC